MYFLSGQCGHCFYPSSANMITCYRVRTFGKLRVRSHRAGVKLGGSSQRDTRALTRHAVVGGAFQDEDSRPHPRGGLLHPLQPTRR